MIRASQFLWTTLDQTFGSLDTLKILLSPFIFEYGFIATQQEISEGFGLSYETASLINGALSLGILLLVIIDGKKDSF